MMPIIIMTLAQSGRRPYTYMSQICTIDKTITLKNPSGRTHNFNNTCQSVWMEMHEHAVIDYSTWGDEMS